ncbi:MAG: PIN domain-containing protein [Candidatus Hydrogenedentes bacterium]|nr:PIN domain-containing protein [Candidatus Hydrogenedentota bacterium]
MILIDTSVWIEFFRLSGDERAKQCVERNIAAGEAGFTCPIYFEIMAGVRAHEIAIVKRGLSYCKRFMFKPRFWDAAALAYRQLRTQGLTIPKEDVYVAAAASGLALPLLCRDKHFDVIRDNSDLELDLEQLA